MSGRPGAAEFLRKRLGTHVRVKVAMFITACLIWLFIRLDQTTTMVVPVPVRVDLSGLPGKVLLQHPPDKVSVTLQGRGRSLLGFLFFHKGEYVVVPQEHSSQNHATEVTHLVLTGRNDLAVLTISPVMFNMELDDELIRTVPITLRVKVEPSEGYRLREEPDFRPRTVEVRGPRRLLDTLGTVYTDADDLGRLRKDLSVGVALSLPFHDAELQIGSVVLTALVERLGERRIENVPLKVTHNRKRLVVDPLELAVVITGPQEELDKLEASDIRAVLDLNLLEEDQQELECEVTLPDGLVLKETIPPVFRIETPDRTRSGRKDSTKDGTR